MAVCVYTLYFTFYFISVSSIHINILIKIHNTNIKYMYRITGDCVFFLLVLRVTTL